MNQRLEKQDIKLRGGNMKALCLDYYCANCGKKSKLGFENKEASKKWCFDFLTFSKFLWTCSDKCKKEMSDNIYNNLEK